MATPDSQETVARLQVCVFIKRFLHWSTNIARGYRIEPSNTIGATETAEPTPDIAAWQLRSASHVRIRLAFINQTAVHGLVVLYHMAVPWCLLAACLCYGLAAFRALRRSLGPRVHTFAAATLCLLAIMTRCLLLAFVDAIAIPTINPQYLSNVYPLMLLFFILAIAIVWPDGSSSHPRKPLRGWIAPP